MMDRFTGVFDEVFLNLNDTDWGAESGLDRNRIFAGIGWKPKSMPYLKGEVGYLNQLIDRPSGIHRMDHLLSLNLFLNLNPTHAPELGRNGFACPWLVLPPSECHAFL